jgi:hypothetical protein
MKCKPIWSRKVRHRPLYLKAISIAALIVIIDVLVLIDWLIKSVAFVIVLSDDIIVKARQESEAARAEAQIARENMAAMEQQVLLLREGGQYDELEKQVRTLQINLDSKTVDHELVQQQFYNLSAEHEDLQRQHENVKKTIRKQVRFIYIYIYIYFLRVLIVLLTFSYFVGRNHFLFIFKNTNCRLTRPCYP